MRKLIFIAAIFFSGYMYGQNIFPPDSIRKKITALEIQTNLKVDGKLDEQEWQNANRVPDFIQMDPFQGNAARKKTIVKLLYNKQYLFIGAVCYDTVGRTKYRVANFKRDFGLGVADDFAVAIDGYNDDRNAVVFITNPYGVQSDLLSFDDNYYDTDWDGLWIVRTQRYDTAWVAEIAIPWKSLRYKDSKDLFQTWGISFMRMARTDNELSAWPAFPRAYSPMRMVYAGKLQQIKAPPPSMNLRLQPYTLFSSNLTKENNNTIISKNTVKPGGDIKWAINSNSLLDVTFNTDFAQADVDRKVNNINRFSVFFPERRQFFLENAGLFAVGIEPLPGNGLADYSARIQPFFSRTIGLDNAGKPVSITGGARFVSRTDKRNIGVLAVRQAETDNSNPAYFTAARYSQNFGKQNRIGLLVTYKAEEDKKQSIVDNGLTGTVDGFFRFNQKFSLSYMGSFTNNKRDSMAGYAAAAQALYNSNNLVAWWNQSFNTETYNPKMGFVARQNVIITEPGFYYQIRAKWLPKFVRAVFPGMSYITYHNTTTLKLTDRYLNIIPLWCRFQNRTLLFYNIVFTLQNLESPLTILGSQVNKGVYSYTRQKFGFASDLSKKLSGTITFNLGDFYNGKYNAITTVVNIAPSPHFFLSPSWETGKLEKFGKDSTTRNVNLLAVECRLALNPRLQLSSLFQKASTSSSVNWNMRFSWEFKPLSYVYLVYNNNTVSQTINTNDQQVIAKISYLKQF